MTQPFTTLTGVAAPLMIANLDTDQILPKQFLKTITRSGLGGGLFYDFRFAPDGARIAGFILNRKPYADANILIAGENFGCGSSREHAPWALLDFGISCVIAPSFADIFYNNCFNNGLLPIVLPGPVVEALAGEAGEGAHLLAIDLPDQTVRSQTGRVHGFEIDPIRKQKLLRGLDAIGETVELDAAIHAFETARRERGVLA